MSHAARVAVAAAVTIGLVAGTARPDATPAADCARLASLHLAGGAISRAAVASDHGNYCRVAFTLTPTSDSLIRAELWLAPRARWNGKFQGVGNGGLAGEIPYAALAAGLQRGYATAGSDTGHDNAAGVGRFALGHPEKIVDYGHRAIHLTALAGRAIVAAYYGRPARHRYFVGCSQGGQEALMEAQRYPGDYDGIVAGDPDYHQTHHEVGAHLWVLSSFYADPASRVSLPQAVRLGAAVDAACDALDGIVDGVLDDPRRCHFDPAALQCRDGHHPPNCLSAAQVEAVRRFWAGPDELAGAGYYPGFERGGEASLWSGWLIADSAADSLHGALGLPFFRYFLGAGQDSGAGHHDFDFRRFDYRRDPRSIDQLLGPGIDATNPDLREFQRHGGRLLHYHGFSDPDVPPRVSTGYYERVHALARARGEAAAVDDYYRLFMVPGMGHCGAGPGPNGFDALGALERWVEQGAPPQRILATRYRDDDPAHGVLRTRPLCPYPQVARYRGRGSTDDARSFDCQLPPPDGPELGRRNH